MVYFNPKGEIINKCISIDCSERLLNPETPVFVYALKVCS